MPIEFRKFSGIGATAVAQSHTGKEWIVVMKMPSREWVWAFVIYGDPEQRTCVSWEYPKGWVKGSSANGIWDEDSADDDEVFAWWEMREIAGDLSRAANVPFPEGDFVQPSDSKAGRIHNRKRL